MRVSLGDFILFLMHDVFVLVNGFDGNLCTSKFVLRNHYRIDAALFHLAQLSVLVKLVSEAQVIQQSGHELNTIVARVEVQRAGLAMLIV